MTLNECRASGYYRQNIKRNYRGVTCFFLQSVVQGSGMGDNGNGELKISTFRSSLVSLPAFPTLSRLVSEVVSVDKSSSLRRFSMGGMAISGCGII